MKRVILSAALFLFAGLSSAYAQNQTDMNPQITPQGAEVQPYLRSCDSPYLGHNESCMSNTASCPAGYEFSQANYCCGSDGTHYRCGTVCKSIYAPGH